MGRSKCNVSNGEQPHRHLNIAESHGKLFAVKYLEEVDKCLTFTLVGLSGSYSHPLWREEKEKRIKGGLENGNVWMDGKGIICLIQ